MLLKIFEDATSLARAAAEDAAASIQKAIAEQGRSRLVLATGNSQIKFLEILTAMAGINWTRVEAFHLDEYVGLARTHAASFRKFLLERVIRKTGIVHYHFVEGDARDLSAAIREV